MFASPDIGWLVDGGMREGGGRRRGQGGKRVQHETSLCDDWGVKFDDIIAVVEWCAWVWPQGRFLVEGHERTRRRRRTDARSGYSGGGGRGGSVSRGGRRYDWSGRERCSSTARCIVRPR